MENNEIFKKKETFEFKTDESVKRDTFEMSKSLPETKMHKNEENPDENIQDIEFSEEKSRTQYDSDTVSELLEVEKEKSYTEKQLEKADRFEKFYIDSEEIRKREVDEVDSKTNLSKKALEMYEEKFKEWEKNKADVKEKEELLLGNKDALSDMDVAGVYQYMTMCIQNLKDYLDGPSGIISAEQKSVAIVMTEKMYEMAIGGCVNFTATALKLGKKGNILTLAKTAEELAEKLRAESKVLVSNIDSLSESEIKKTIIDKKEGKKATVGDTVSYGELLHEVRCYKFENRGNSAGGINVRGVKKRGGKKYYFAEEENPVYERVEDALKRDTSSAGKRVYSAYLSTMEKVPVKFRDFFRIASGELILRLFARACYLVDEKKHNRAMDITADRLRAFDKSGIPHLTMFENSPFFQLFYNGKGKMNDSVLKKFVSGSFAAFGNLATMYTLPGINSLSTPARRHVATTKLAKKLGIEGVIAHSESAMAINAKGELVKGNLMEEAGKISLYDLIYKTNEKKIKVAYTAEAVRQLFMLQVFDLICGQIDRHAGNIMVDFKKDMHGTIHITGVKGIDNDASFGNLGINEVMGGVHNLPGFTVNKRNTWNAYTAGEEHERSMKEPFRYQAAEEYGGAYFEAAPWRVMDKKFYNSVMKLDVSMLIYEFADLHISREEISALSDRLNGMKEVLRQNKEFYDKLYAEQGKTHGYLLDDNEWDKLDKATIIHGDNGVPLEFKSKTGLVNNLSCGHDSSQYSTYVFMGPTMLGKISTIK